MLDHERRSYAPPLPPPESTGQRPRGRWIRPDVLRPVPPARVPLPSPNPMVAEIEEPEDAEDIDVMDMLSVEARRDVLAGSVAGFSGGAL